MALRSLFYDIRFNISDRRIRDADRRVDDLNRGLGRTNTQLVNLQRTSSGLNLGGILGAAGGIFAIKRAGNAIFNLANIAGQAEEANNVFAVSFRKLTNEATDFSDAMAMNVGRSIFKTRQSFGRMQNILVGFTDGTDDAREAMFDLNKLITPFVTDLNSLQNVFVDDSEAMDQFLSGLVGNHTALRRFGIVLTETNLDMRRQALGLDTSFRKLDPLSKLYVRFSESVEQSRDAVGDLENTQFSYTNSLRSMTDQFFDMRVELGNELIPVMIDLIREIIDNKEEVKAFALEFVQFARDVIPMVRKGFVFLTENGEDVADVLKLMVTGFAALKIIGGIIALITTLAPVIAETGFAIAAVIGGAATFGEGIALVGGAIIALFGGPVGAVVAVIFAIIGAILFLRNHLDIVQLAFDNFREGFIENVITPINDFLESIGLLGTNVDISANLQGQTQAVTGGRTFNPFAQTDNVGQAISNQNTTNRTVINNGGDFNPVINVNGNGLATNDIVKEVKREINDMYIKNNAILNGGN